MVQIAHGMSAENWCTVILQVFQDQDVHFVTYQKYGTIGHGLQTCSLGS